MKQSIFTEESDRSLCAETTDDDGQSLPVHGRPGTRGRPSRIRPGQPRAGHPDRKTGQLCRQVAHALDAVLAECGDPVLQGLQVASVEPFPDASRLIVTVTFIDDRPVSMIEAASVLDHLHRASGHLRYEVATAVTRRRAPLLIYRLAEPSAAGLIHDDLSGNL
jgi:ribosome-binding factor A